MSFHFFPFWSQDHPRIRGEHRPRGPSRKSACGSSPHTRGAPPDGKGKHAHRRIIPAYAGSTTPSSTGSTTSPDHPRIRGDDPPISGRAGSRTGSSPHTRGARQVFPRGCRRLGIIPAYAGSTLASAPLVATEEDHPRIRGEHGPPRSISTSQTGSSPHTRGARKTPASIRPSPGIIPAYAGSTGPRPPARRTSTDHPRIRGEHSRRSKDVLPTSGSSPHTRGARRIPPRFDGRGGIIPAYAGSTQGLASGLRACRDHPRIRGEHRGLSCGHCSGWGSSPHTRGARPGIPSHSSSVPDHPRIRGEHFIESFQIVVAGGSSPHTRGARAAAAVVGSSDRIIPAYAGSTWRRTGRRPRFRGSSPHTRGARFR